MDMNPANLHRELRAAERFRDSFLHDLDERIDRYTGPHYRNGRGCDNPENPAHEWLALNVAKLAFDNPRYKAQTKRAGPERMVAEAIKHGMDRWARDNRVRTVLQRIVYDMSFCHACIHTCQRPKPGSNNPKNWPEWEQVPPRRFFFDPLCMFFGEARYAGHVRILPKGELEQEAKAENEALKQEAKKNGLKLIGLWDTEKIKALKTDVGMEGTGGERGKASSGRGSDSDIPDRKEVAIQEVWFPHEELPGSPGPDKGFHGTIYTLVRGQEDVGFVRAPRPFYGPRWGPYSLVGAYVVPQCPYPLSPLTVVESQSIELNAHAEACNKSARAYKRIVLVSESYSMLDQKLIDSEHDWVVKVPGLQRDQVIPIEIAGVTDQMIKHMALARERMDRALGMDEAQRGNVDPDAKATAIAVADSASTTRLSLIKQQFTDAVVMASRTVAWYLYHDDRIVFPLGSDVSEEMGLSPDQGILFLGGVTAEGSGASFDDLELEIEPYSMERTNEAQLQRTTLALYDLLMQSLPIIPQTASFVDWKELWGGVCDVFNQPKMAEAIEMDKLAVIAGMEPGALGQVGQGPRLARQQGELRGGGAPNTGRGGYSGEQAREQPDRPLAGRQSGSRAGADMQVA